MTYNKELMEESIRMFLKAINVNLEDEHFKDTPKRVAEMNAILFDKRDPNQYVKMFKNEGYFKPVMQANINFYSYCAHHLQPFYGQIAIAYIPDKTIIGLSKLSRIARTFTRKPTTQEQLTTEIGRFLQICDLKPKGVAIIILSSHMCLSKRGVRSHGLITRTEFSSGQYKNDTLFERFERFVNKNTNEIFRY